MLAPPGEEVLRGRKATTGAVRAAGTAVASAPSTRRVPAARSTPARVAVSPAMAGQTSARESGVRRADGLQGKDYTLIYIGAGAVLLLLAVGASLLLFKDNKKQPQTPAKLNAKSTDAGRKNSNQPAEKTVREPVREPKKPTPVEVPTIRPTEAVKTPEPARRTETPAVAVQIPSDVPRLLVRKPATVPTLDGVLDDACWTQATECVLEFIQGKVGRPAARGAMRVVASDTTMYVGVRFDEDELSKVPLPVKERDSSAWADDCVELFMLPGLDAEKDYYQWVASISNAVWDGKKSGTTTNPALWDGEDIKHKVKLFDKYWCVEIAVPFDALPGMKGQSAMRFNLTRNRPRLEGLARAEEYSSWSILRTTTSHTPARYGVLAFEALGGKLP